MFIKNPSSISKKIITCSQAEYEFLVEHNYIPLSKDENGWIFLDCKEIKECLKNYKGGE